MFHDAARHATRRRINPTEEVLMVKQNAKAKETLEERSPLFEAARRVLLAGMGAVALTQDEVDKFVDKLVERGEIAREDAKKLVREMAEKRGKQGRDELDKRVQDLLDRMNVPTKSDLEALSAKITALTEKVDELNKTQGS
jgi:polyhydroxyalkanoate synthesis regulator phasin